MLGERKAAPTAVQVAAAKEETHVEVRAQILASAKRMPMGALPLLHAGVDTSQDEAGRLRLLAWWALEAHLGSPSERAGAVAAPPRLRHAETWRS